MTASLSRWSPQRLHSNTPGPASLTSASDPKRTYKESRTLRLSVVLEIGNWATGAAVCAGRHGRRGRPGRAFWQQIAHLLDQGEAAESESAQVKLLATEMAVRVTNQAMQLHGGNGYTTERRIERYWRDARLTTIFEGTSEIQRRIISDRMLPRA